MNGFINLIKPSGMSSAYAVTAVKKKFNMPCGHMGTLDPMASGVLPVGIGQASRLFDYLLNKTKKYRATFIFGEESDTLDITGNIVNTCTYIPKKEEILAVLPQFLGKIDQIPPKYSAKCINGKRGYQLARKGVEFELKPKQVEILSLELVEQISTNEFVFDIECGGGTYIRSLARDIAYACNSLGSMKGLVRRSSGIFDIEKGVSVEEFINSSTPEQYLIASDAVVDFPKIVLDEKRATKILNGVFEKTNVLDGIYRVYNCENFWGIGVAEKGVLKIKTYVR